MIMKSKSISMMNKQVQDVADKISIHSTYKLLGSNSYRGMIYPSDVDLFSPDKTKETSMWLFFKNLFTSKEYVRGDFLFMDFKAGLNHALLFDEEENVASYLERNKSVIPKDIQDGIKNSRGEERQDLMKDLYVLRWTPDEIIKGEKTVYGGSKISFENAVKDDTIIKLDVAVPTGYTFIDLTEVYTFQNKPISKAEMIRQLEEDVSFYSRRNTLKSMKRMYSVLKVNNTNKKMQKQLVDIFNSPLGAMNKLKNDIDYFIAVCEKHTIAWDVIQMNLQMFKHTYFNFEDSQPMFSKKIDDASKKDFIKILEELSDALRIIINQKAKIELEKL